MNYQQLQREIELQEQWANELMRHKSRNDHERADSQRQLLAQDDQRIG